MNKSSNPDKVFSLAGKWDLKLCGYNNNHSSLADAVFLPGTLDENKKGIVNPNRHTGNLHKEYFYEGPAVYQKIITIPEEWRNKRIKLLLERTKMASIYIDGNYCGSQDSISTSQVYDVTKYLTVGEHTLAIEVYNASGIMSWDTIRNSHAVSESTQTNWNGILGRIELQIENKISIENIKAFPNIKNNNVHLIFEIRNKIDKQVKFKFTIRVAAWNTNIKHDVKEETYIVDVESYDGYKTIELDYNLGNEVQLWDEFNCTLYKMEVALEARCQGLNFTDYYEINFGMREIGTKGTNITINGKNTFLRGKHDACLFPLTGYAPMDVNSWIEVFKKAKAYGINHYRFHSICPPDAAFTAADIVGVYLQPELPLWDPVKAFEEDTHWEYYKTEAIRILNEFGNHPSFIMFAWGNELAGCKERMRELIKICKKLDSRHLYSHGSNNFLAKPEVLEGIDYWSTMWTEGEWDFKECGFGGKFVRGSFAHHTRGHINNEEPSTMIDYSYSISDVTIPVIGHEVGQYQIHPNFKEIDKFTGILKPENLKIFRENLREMDLLKYSDNFSMASGKLAVLCYREEIETALRTEGFGGFQLLDLQDFPAQGTALVGILDSFMDSKGLISEGDWRNFCCETVPLLRMEKYVWENNECFRADIDVANYGPGNIENRIYCRIRNLKGDLIFEHLMDTVKLIQGKVTRVGQIVFNLSDIDESQKLIVEIGINNTKYKNFYNIWVYEALLSSDLTSGIKISQDFNEAINFLEQGEKVLFLPLPDCINNTVQGAFIPDFWCYSMFKKYTPPGTLGLWCNPEHSALENFITDFHTDWQWWHLLKKSRPVILDKMPKDYRPIVQIIDNISRLHKLGLVFELNVAKGKLLVCSIDLIGLRYRPEAKQLLNSLINYTKSIDFKPKWNISIEMLNQLFYSDNTVMSKKSNTENNFFG